MTAFDAQGMRRVLGHYATGVVVITARVDGRPHGMACNSFTSVSLAPPLVGFCPARGSETWAAMRRQDRFCVNVLGRGHEELCRQFAAKDADRFAGVAHRPAPSGSPRLDDAIAWIDCELFAELEAGDHFIVLARPREMGVRDGADPLVFFGGRYGRFLAA